MSTGAQRLAVEIGDLEAAAEVMLRIGVETQLAYLPLRWALNSGAAMAGNDPAGLEWAQVYDRAARTVLTGLQQAVNATYKLSALYAQTGHNYLSADLASVAGLSVTDIGRIDTLRHVTQCSISSDVPSAAGGSGGGPPGWDLVQHLVGYVWPNGHQDRLHAAAGAWRSMANTLRDLGQDSRSAVTHALIDNLPEAEDIAAVSWALDNAFRGVADAMDLLAQSCDEYAHAIDQVHSEVEDELAELVAFTAASEGVAGLFAVVSLGVSEAAEAAVEASRVARAVTAIIGFIKKYKVLVKFAMRGVAHGAILQGNSPLHIAGKLVGLIPVAAPVQGVPAPPSVVDAGAAAALIRIAQGARGRPALTGGRGPLKHAYGAADEFGVTGPATAASLAEYRKNMDNFVADGATVRVAATKGVYDGQPAILNYNPASRLVVVQHPDGTFWTAGPVTDQQLAGLRGSGRLDR